MSNASRTHVVDTVVRLVAAHGVEAATVRRVAAEAGVSIGMVQHHFPTKDAMLRAAMEAAGASFRARAQRACAGLGAAPALRALARELLPLDAARGDEGRVWLAFVARAAVDPVVRAAHAEGWQQLEDHLTGLLAAHRGRDEAGVDRDDARLLLAVLDGLAVGGLVEHARLAPERIVAVVDAHLDAVLGDRAP